MKCYLTTGFAYADIERLFRTELAREHKRTSVALAEEKGMAIFTVSAQDVSSLRAALNSITSILAVYEATHAKA